MIINWTIFVAHINLITRMTFGCNIIIITFLPTLFFITLSFPSLLISFWLLRIFRWRFIIFFTGVIFCLRIFFFCLVPINDPYPLRVARTTAFRLWNFTKVSRQITPQKLLSGQFIILRLLNDPLRNAVWTP